MIEFLETACAKQPKFNAAQLLTTWSMMAERYYIRRALSVLLKDEDEKDQRLNHTFAATALMNRACGSIPTRWEISGLFAQVFDDLGGISYVPINDVAYFALFKSLSEHRTNALKILVCAN